MSEECLKNAQDLTKSQKHDPLTHSPIWIQEMLAHLKITQTREGSPMSALSFEHNDPLIQSILILMSISLFLRFEGCSYRDVPPRVVSSGPRGAVTPPISVSSSPFSTATIFISWSLSQSTFPLFLDKNALSSRANHVVVVIIHFLIYVPPSSPPFSPSRWGSLGARSQF